MFYLDHFEMMDYIVFFWFFALAFLFLILSFMLMARYVLLGIFVAFALIVILVTGPFVGKWFLNDTFRHVDVNITKQKQLTYTNTFIINANLTNRSKKTFSICKVYSGFIKSSKSKYKNILNALKPLNKKSFILTKQILPNQNIDFRIVYDNFRKSKDTNLTVKAECYK